jgi:hypothetical protein
MRKTLSSYSQAPMATMTLHLSNHLKNAWTSPQFSFACLVENNSSVFIDLTQEETRVSDWVRVGPRVRELRPLGHVVAQESFLPITVVRSLHPRPMTFKDAITLRHLIGGAMMMTAI